MKNNSKKPLYIILCILLVLLVGVACGLGFWYLTAGKIDDDPYKNPKAADASSGELRENPINFDALQSRNPDIYAWITIPNTRIDYPVLQSYELDDNFYINHDMDRKYLFAGCIYSQKANSINFDDPNTVLYGHNMKNGTMFRDLRKFRDKTFFEQNEYFNVYTKGHILTYRVFAAYRYDNRHILNSFDFTDKSVFEEYLAFAANPVSSLKNVREGVNLTVDDCILTLSTCMDNGKNRYLVQGVLIKDEPTK